MNNINILDSKTIAKITQDEVSDVWQTWLQFKPICCFKGCKDVRTQYSVFCFKHMYRTIKTAIKTETN